MLGLKAGRIVFTKQRIHPLDRVDDYDVCNFTVALLIFKAGPLELYKKVFDCSIPHLRWISAEFNVGSSCTFVQSGLGHSHGSLLLIDGSFDLVNSLLSGEHFLKCLSKYEIT